MKIIYLHQYFNTPNMSGGTRSYEMARRFVAAGHEVHMVTSYREKKNDLDDWFETEEAGINVHWFPVPYTNHLGFFARIKAFLKFAFQAKKKAVELNGDIIFATSTPLTIALPAVPAAKQNGIPLVFEVRDLWPEMPIAVGAINNSLLRWVARKLESWAYYNSESVVALSPGMKDGVVRVGYSSERVAVIPNSSDNEEFKYDKKAGDIFRSERKWLGNSPLLVYTGTLGPTNGVGYLVELAVELKKLKSDIKILIVGDGAERLKIQKNAENSGVLNKNLFIEKRLPKKNMPALLSAATIASALFIDLPEMRANSANKFFDALGASKPILINYGGWMHDLVRDHECGLPMWNLHISAVAKELDHKIHNKEWLTIAGNNARSLAEDYFARDLLAGQLLDVLSAALNKEGYKASKIAPGDYR